MLTSGALALVVGGALSTLAALAHLACIAIGAPAYRLMGAGEKMTLAVEARRRKPTLITLAISCVLFAWAAYALSGAGVIGPLPMSKIALPTICMIYLARAFAFPLLKPAFPENTQRFWIVSSSICLLMGLLHLYGVVALWPTL